MVQEWYARILAFQGDVTVSDMTSLNAADYREDAICIVILWFHHAKEVRKYLSTKPRTDARDHLMAALHKDQHLAGISEDTISWTTVEGDHILNPRIPVANLVLLCHHGRQAVVA